jgi:hypothetical protein
VPEERPVQRRLAVILAGDVVGYSRLMGVDEVGCRLPRLAKNDPSFRSEKTGWH